MIHAPYPSHSLVVQVCLGRWKHPGMSAHFTDAPGGACEDIEEAETTLKGNYANVASTL